MLRARRTAAVLTALLCAPLVALTPIASASSSGAANPPPAPGFFTPSVGDDETFRADLEGLRTQLAGDGAHEVSIPTPSGQEQIFLVSEDSVLAPALQAAHPEIRTYAGHGADGSSIRLDITPLGMHAMVRTPGGSAWYVDPVRTAPGESRVRARAGDAVSAPPVRREAEAAERSAPTAADPSSDPGGLVSTRTYRLALVSTKSLADQVGTENVTAAKATWVNRLDLVFGDELAIRFEMVDGTDALNLDTTAKQTGTNGPCAPSACFTATSLATCGPATLTRMPFALERLIGSANYDIGHLVFGVSAGFSSRGVVGGPDKAGGCSGSADPTDDGYVLDYLAHEIGHQMGAESTFNGVDGQCTGGPSTRVEPGSGSSIMGYAGSCGSDDLQAHADPSFSFASADQIEAATSTPTTASERQVVNLSGFVTGNSFTLSCDGCPTSAPVTRGSDYVASTLAQRVQEATGEAARVSAVTGAAFTVDWESTDDVPTLTVQPVVGDFTSSTGTIFDGGPTDPGGTVTESTNHAPVVVAPADRNIPTGTPFTLTGDGSDEDGDELTYVWEQTDAGTAPGTALLDNAKEDGPLFRSPSSEERTESGDLPTRTFPDLDQVLNGPTNAATGECPDLPDSGPVPPGTVDCFSEFLPTSDWRGDGSRVLHFRLTASDASPPDAGPDHAAGRGSDDVALTVDPTAGPFLVTSRATAGTPGAGPEIVTWSVAGTDRAALAPLVRVSLSIDGGQTFPIELASSTPNDGSELVVLPEVTTSHARIKVEAVGNYFFDVNDADFAIEPTGGNAAPVVDAGPDGVVTVGAVFTSAGTFADDRLTGEQLSVDYGGGAGPQPLAFSGASFALQHTYTSPGVKTVTVRATDYAGLTATDTATVTVRTTSSTTGKAKPRRVHRGRGFRVKVSVASSVAPAGEVELRLGTKLLGVATLREARATVRVGAKRAEQLRAGRNELTLVYLGSPIVVGSQTPVSVRMVRPKR
ncbi:hypothetical protein G5V58_13190 [Nocardioides anomalus]|uniref:PKD domain-containing protein n=1 Tax=Nocardioides anomalus TaxID=2712223 RepID=A0A6G6WEF2_9ACTN|nr:M12 family metallo-peptidase [Nocardioides anomalus]QIG43586.1 hypothetical protein G5V58_13190 [Nocardioides anomalus]